jgi:hypothetical protein
MLRETAVAARGVGEGLYIEATCARNQMLGLRFVVYASADCVFKKRKQP